MTDITYDIESLKRAKTSVDGLIDTLNECNTNLNTDMQDLKDAWQTDAGKKFFEEHQDTWTEYVKKYVARMNGVSNMLQKAIDYYEKINNEVAKLKV